MRRGLAISGGLGGLLWIAVLGVAPEDEILRNRIWTIALLGMTLGFHGLFASLGVQPRRSARVASRVMLAGLILLTAGSFVEYWLLFWLPHQGGLEALIRSLPWMAFLLGAFLTFGASVALGVSMFATQGTPRWLGLLFLALLPLTVALGFVHAGLAAVPIAALAASGLVVRGGTRSSQV